jgi:catechol 2,3-dioxygenase-like lactoylglutathione lyase family enzyme
VSRVQVALNVSDLDAAVVFYTRFFSSPPTKLRPGYANFAIADPPLKLVLIETASGRSSGLMGALNHLGVEVESDEDVARAHGRLAASGLTPTEEHQTTCCYALQDKVWIEDPDGAPWEVYSVLADADSEAGSGQETESPCCQPQGEVAPAATTACC